MSSEVLSGQVGELRALSTAAGGTALTTTAGYTQLPKGTYHLYVTPRNFSTAVVAKFCLNPWLVVLKTIVGMTSAPTDYSESAQDADTTTQIVLSSLPALADGGFLLIGSHLPFRGVRVEVDDSHPNGTTSTLVVYYPASGVWTDTSATDGTSSSSKTFAQDGLVYWTVPSGWTPATLKSLYPATPDSAYTNLNYYWTRWSVSAALDSDTLVEAMVAANRSTAYAELLAGQTFEERVTRGLGGIGCLEALTNAGTANLIVNGATVRDGKFS